MTRRKQKSIFQAIAELRAAWKPAARKLAELRTGWEQIAALFAPAAAPPGRRPEKRTAIERPIIEVFPGGIPDDFSPAEIVHAVRGAAGF